MKPITKTLAALVLLSLLSCGNKTATKPMFVWIEVPANFYFYANNREAIYTDCRRIAAAGFTDIIVEVRPTSGDVLFRSSVAPPLTRIGKWTDDALRYVDRTADFDYLEAFIKAGHEASLRVHAAINMMVGGFECDAGGGIGILYSDPRYRDWASVDNTPDGLVNQLDDYSHEGGRFMDPANPEVQEFLLTLLGELASYEGLDGIVMDRCRYDDYALDAGYTAEALRQFTEYLGHEPERWPVMERGHIFLDKTPDALEAAWLTFRCKVIHDFVEKAAAKVHATAPGVQFANYVGGWFSEYYRSGVNWCSPDYDVAANEPEYAWAGPEYGKTGIADLLDYIFIGAYTGVENIHGTEEKTMEGYARLARRRLAGAVRFAAGPDLGNQPGFDIGNQHSAIPEIVKTMNECADGSFFFDLCHIRLYNYWDCFK